jgi:hypothetical protein
VAVLVAWLAVPVLLDLSPAVVCPNERQLAEALGRQGMEATDAAHARAVLNLEHGDGGDLLLRFREMSGQALLARRLPKSECGALADTVALIVERRIRDLGWVEDVTVARHGATIAPATTGTVADRQSPAVKSTIEIRAGALLAADLDPAGPVAGPWAGFRIRPREQFEAGFSVGWVRYQANVSSGVVTFDEIPVALDAGYAFAHGRWELGVRGRLELAIMTSSSRDIARTEQTSGLSSRVGPALSASLRLWRTWWLSLEGGAGIRVSGYQWTIQGLGPIAEQRPLSLSAAVSLGTRWKF